MIVYVFAYVFLNDFVFMMFYIMIIVFSFSTFFLRNQVKLNHKFHHNKT